MRISDVLASRLFDIDGTPLGRVRDVRLVMDGPVRGSLAALRVDAIIVGGDAVAGRLGYLRGGVRGPALLLAVLGRRERRAATYVATDVAEWDTEHRRLVLTAGATPEDEPDAI